MAAIKVVASAVIVAGVILAAVMASATQLAAQGPPAAAGAAPPAGVPKAAVAEPKLVFDREVFSYPGNGRRDPFKPLIGKESLGPLFDDLKLKGIIYTGDPKRSIALIQDGAKRLYRLHPGDVVGNSRVVEIRPLAVRFAVENFGMIRNELLELRTGAADASGLRESTQPTPATGPMQRAPANAAEAKRMLDSLAQLRREQPAKQNNNDEPPFLQEQRR